ncbi:MAG: putative glycoside hydrolase [Actinomycetota bacterium]
MRRTSHTRTFIAAALVLATLVATPTAASARPPNFDRLLKNKPYVRLWTEANACGENAAVNGLAGSARRARIASLTRWYRHFNSQGSNRFLLGRDCRGRGSTTLASKLAARGAWVSNYRNGSFASQASRTASLNFHEAASLEKKIPTSIATFWPGDWLPYRRGNRSTGAARLRARLSAHRTTVRISSAAALKPAGAPATWPYISSRGSGMRARAHSRNTHDVVSWIRIDNELMKVVAPPRLAGGDVILRVRRGLWGTRPARHGARTRVMSPVYVGSASLDRGLSGAPSRNDANYPLRYSIKIWKTPAHRWLIRRIRTTFGRGFQGYNAIWLDTTSCVQYSNSDPFGNQVFGWNDPAHAKLTPGAWGRAQRQKLRALDRAFPHHKLLANNLGNTNTCTEQILRSSVDGGAFEHWMKWGTGGVAFDWSSDMRQLIQVMRHNWPAMLWVRWDQHASASPAQYRRFSYGSMLLAQRPRARRVMYGGPWGLQRPDDLYFWNWGRPRETRRTIGALRVPGTPLYRRDFAHGVVVVNPGSSAVTLRLGRTFYDALHMSGGRPTAVRSVTIPGHDAAFLLRSA